MSVSIRQIPIQLNLPIWGSQAQGINKQIAGVVIQISVVGGIGYSQRRIN